MGTGDPPFRAIADDLRRRLRGAEWGPGARLPNRRVLSREYGVAVNTVGRAIALLAEEGLITTTARHGTFVATPGPAAGAHAGIAARGAVARAGPAPIVGIANMVVPGEAPTGWGPTVQRASEMALSALGASTRFFRIEGRGNALARTLSRAVASGVDAILVVYLQDCTAWVEAAAETFLTSGRPLMLVGTTPLRQAVPHTYVDERAGGFMAAEDLLAAGYERLCLLTPFAPPGWLRRRLEGARLAVGRAVRRGATLTVLPERPALDWHEWSERQSGPARGRIVDRLVSEALETMDLGSRTAGSCAFIVPNDRVAELVASALRRRGLKLGRDVGLVGFDDIPEAAELGVTSVRPPLVEMAGIAAQSLVDASRGAPLPTQVCVPPRLIRRDSTLRTPAASAFAG